MNLYSAKNDHEGEVPHQSVNKLKFLFNNVHIFSHKNDFCCSNIPAYSTK